LANNGFKSGFVTVIGRPNVGKSTLINNLIGQKVVITSDKPQTTRNTIRAVLTTESYQAVFIDTPGIHKARNKLGDFMVKSAIDTLKHVDVIVFLTDAKKTIGPGDMYILEMLKQIKTPTIFAVNKIDKMTGEEVVTTIAEFADKKDFCYTIGISALDLTNFDSLTKAMVECLPEGPKYYPEDMVTDQPERLIVAELIREKILNLAQEEVPHGTAVEVIMFEHRLEKNIFYISANIYCEKESHKGIIIGKSGALLRQIGQQARYDIENLLGTRVYLDLWVKIKKKWRENENFLRTIGYGPEK
jgi:GTP-binding protein Era